MGKDNSLNLLWSIRAALDDAIEALSARPHLEAEATLWERKYTELLDQSIQTSEATMGNMLKLFVLEK